MLHLGPLDRRDVLHALALHSDLERQARRGGHPHRRVGAGNVARQRHHLLEMTGKGIAVDRLAGGQHQRVADRNIRKDDRDDLEIAQKHGA